MAPERKRLITTITVASAPMDMTGLSGAQIERLRQQFKRQLETAARRAFGMTNSEPIEDLTLTPAKLSKARGEWADLERTSTLRDLPTRIIYSESRKDDATKLADAMDNPPFLKRPLLQFNERVPEGFIVAMGGNGEVLWIIKPERPEPA